MREPNILHCNNKQNFILLYYPEAIASAVNVTECNEVTFVDGNFGSLPVEG